MPSGKPALLYNLLDDALLGVEDDHGERTKVTLPGLLARLSQGKPTTLTALQAHQQHAMHAFVVQLAAIALHRGSTTKVENDEPAWKRLLLSAAKRDGAGAEAFTLVVADLSKPAFLQPPVPEGTLEALKNEHGVPAAELDVLVTAKNHDVKIARLSSPNVEHWAVALVALQTMQGVFGARNYGIVRMNSGYGSRPCVAFADDHGWTNRFRRDVLLVLDSRAGLVKERGFASKGELGLVWCAPWDGNKSLSMAALDPFFIETCRRVRLCVDDKGCLVAHRGSSAVPRIEGKETAGNTGDPWTPVSRKDGKAKTMAEAGFTYECVQDLLFGEWQQGSAGELRAGGGDSLWVGQVLVRGQGKTGGYHERWVAMPPKARRMFARPDERARLADRSKAWVERAATARLKVLKPAVLTLVQGAPEKLKFDDARAEPYLRAFDAAIDHEFFPLLFAQADAPPEEADAVFEKRLFELAQAQLEAAMTSIPVPSARRWRGESHALRVLIGAAHNHFKQAFAHKPAAPSEAVHEEGDVP